MEVCNIAELLDRVMTGDPWHGSNVAQLLVGLSADAAARHPVANGHSVWEIVLHMTGWADEVRARLAGRAAQEPDRGDWPAVDEASAERWSRDQAAMFEAHRRLAAAVRELTVPALDEPVVDYRTHDPPPGAVTDSEGRDRAIGTGLSKYLTLHGLVHHTVYHAGQIALVRKLL